MSDRLDRLVIALAQINPTVGDVAANADRVRAARADAAAQGADLVVFPELVLSGYPPEDLVFRQAFLDTVQAAALALAAETGDGGPALLVGAPWRFTDPDDGRRKLGNAALLMDGGEIRFIGFKYLLPNYGVFDEVRVFSRGPLPDIVTLKGARLGIMVCEDMWGPQVTRHLAEQGADILLVLNGSPFEVDKHGQRLENARPRVQDAGLPLVYVNQVGGQDELVFDGESFVVGADGQMVGRLPSWTEAVVPTTWTRPQGTDRPWTCEAAPLAPAPDTDEAIYRALVMGLADYVNKNGFPGVILGLSGGIDSALSAAVAVDALGPERVWCVMMPSPYTSRDSLEDAEGVAQMLGLRYDTVNIGPAIDAYDQMLGRLFEGRTPDTTEENIQSRARGITLMALSNKFGPMVLSTGNKSEMSVGYATLYGDMCGGFSVLKDVYKTTVTRLSHWRNAQGVPSGMLGPDGPVMPERVITKPPTAELRPDQKDEDSLPPYPVLDRILNGLIEGEQGVSDLIAAGHDDATVQAVWRLLNIAEYKRRQAPPGVKITLRAFGRDRRYPITNRFRG
ncbi:NAD+ synthase [Roseospira marina]|uniref:Glutamine-dependent NAD(+) synthetase n=1 Tax=Roseospira marina TaxID=140057 RepID=A0A5M6I9D9_9PROT|nr:NAD+ synthase [Roseospira marina]KAA5604896.1 NAD+ synthase [Roseospira marina]MBB4315235.1 NAD+ synthase [Roseospira marina]MBB5088235.1 NAD+ synthase [Roseospira marina]